MTVGSLRTHTAAQSVDGRRLPVPRVLRVPKKCAHASRVRKRHGRDPKIKYFRRFGALAYVKVETETFGDATSSYDITAC